MSHDLTALYERLSHDDELQGESNSISNPKAMLEDYAEKNGFTGIRHFTDDGISGTTFERKGLQAMLAEVEKGDIGTIIVKDMSRLGRNYVQMGMLREQLRRANVRLIAVNEGVDTGSGFDDDFLPFRDVINEYYAKDISKKIKSTFKAKGESGKHVAGSPPYGYLKDSGDKNQWLIFEDTHTPIIDQETFDNVQRIRGQVRRYPDGWGEAHPLTGLMYCTDCGGKMYVHRVK